MPLLSFGTDKLTTFLKNQDKAKNFNLKTKEKQNI